MPAMNNAALLANRAVIRLSGEDRRAFLQGLITQDANALTPDRPVFAALLTPQGKILFDFFIVEDGDAFLIDCLKDESPALLKRLTLYKLRAKIVLEIDEALAVYASETSPADTIAFRDPRHDALGWRAIAPKSDSPDTSDAYRARRIALGVPECGPDFGSDNVFLLDVNYDVLGAVSYKKGCFVGQEVTSRMKRKGEIRKRTTLARYDGPALAKGAPVTAGETPLGEVLAAADGAALVLTRMDRWEKAKEAGAPVTCEGRALRLHIPGYLEQA